MAEEYISLTTTNIALNEAETESIATSKDDELSTTMHENGYESECSSSSRSEIDVTRSALEVEADAFTRFIERQRVEVMFELRNLRLGERPVTGQPSRDRIQTFINNVQQQRRQQQPISRIPAAQPAAPSAHMADIDVLANRRYVTAALSSTTFRQDLENAIRRTIEIRSVETPQPRPSSSTSTTLREIPPAPPAPQMSVSNSIPQQTPVVHPRPQIPQRQEPLNIERQERELNSWQAITQLQREIILVEISDLVHRQLVSTALESDFRSHLEQNILTRFARGAPVQQGEQQETPIVAPRVLPTPAPIRHTTQAHTGAITFDDFTTRLNSMEHMLQLMYSMQIDMQRCLRQEVAGALANNTLTSTASSNQPVNSGHCTVCLTATADTVLYRCGHLCVCYMCGLNLKQNAVGHQFKCPICRAPADDILRVYRSSRDDE